MIRPASFCGTIAFKPSFGATLSKACRRHRPAWHRVRRNLELLDAADAVLSGEFDKRESRRDLRIGICRMPAWPAADVEMKNALFEFSEALNTAGFKTCEIELPQCFEGLNEAQAIIHRYEAARLAISGAIIPSRSVKYSGT
ncbi:MAG: hypothetical protein IPF97_11200 [Sphingomonadales bacterium]|nr:hypothetical protein [Sphingomonadales bacterium]